MAYISENGVIRKMTKKKLKIYPQLTNSHKQSS